MAANEILQQGGNVNLIGQVCGGIQLGLNVGCHDSHSEKAFQGHYSGKDGQKQSERLSGVNFNFDQQNLASP